MYGLLPTRIDFGHFNIIKYSNRPFKDVEQMNNALIDNWNSVVKQGDRVYLLGDVCFMHHEDAKKTLFRLNGQIFLIKGNHDKEHFLSKCHDRFVWVKDYFELTIGKQKIILSHYPFMTWNKSHHGSWHLHGHCHGSLPDDPYALRIDVGVDCHGYKPVSFDEVSKLMSKKSFKAIDHHGRGD